MDERQEEEDRTRQEARKLLGEMDAVQLEEWIRWAEKLSGNPSP